MRHLVWLRQDLRVQDNPALYYACLADTAEVVALYLLTPEIWRQHNVSQAQINFMLQSLSELQNNLAALNIPLLIKTAPTAEDVCDVVSTLTKELSITAVYVNYVYGVNEQLLEQSVATSLTEQNVAFHGYHDQVIFEPGSIKTKTHQLYQVFTPFAKACRYALTETPIHLLPIPNKRINSLCNNAPLPPVDDAIFSLNPGELSAQKQLQQFVHETLLHYHQTRDYPVERTSLLSPYLATGMLSIRTCYVTADKMRSPTDDNTGVDTWLNELWWREFYRHLMAKIPRLSKYKPYQLNTERIPWRYDENLFAAWCEGKTGIPIIDAAMRQLAQTHWMHNRLRMVVAMFLTKNLLIDWRWGEKYFMQQLVDGDFASNNGGWQWCASTGTDAVPYFRVFNPIAQSEKYDPDGNFIRAYCPELAGLSAKEIHEPYARAPQKMQDSGYRKPIVNLSESRKKAIDVFQKINRLPNYLDQTDQ